MVFVFPHDLIPSALTKVTKTYKRKGLKNGKYRACFNPSHPYCFTNTIDWIYLLRNYLQTTLRPLVPHLPFLSLLSYERLSKKPLLFKSFTGLTVKEFDNIYNKEIEKRHLKHEIQRLSCKWKEDIERKYGTVDGPFRLDLKDRFLILSIYYCLYITYTLAGFLFDLDQCSVCYRDIQKIEYWILLESVYQFRRKYTT